MPLEKTLVFIKPGNFEQAVEIFSYLEDTVKDFRRDIPLHILPVPDELIRKHYEHINGLSIYEPTIKAFTGSKEGIVLAVYEGKDIIKRVREVIGDTDPKKAREGTIRNIFGRDSFAKACKERRYLNNVIHASANIEEAEKEIEIWEDYIKS